MANKTKQAKISIKNKRASFEYFLIDRLTAGIVLTGTEIKSIREGKASIIDSYCSFIGNELFVIGMHIAEYKFGTFNNHVPKRDRKLLLTAKELRKLKANSNEKGYTIVPIELYINEKGFAKGRKKSSGSGWSTMLQRWELPITVFLSKSRRPVGAAAAAAAI